MRTLYVLVSLICLSLGTVVNADEHESMDAGIVVPDKIEWRDVSVLPPGAKFAVLEGDPTKDVPFVIRIRMPDKYKVPAHTHPKTERVTAMSGTFHIVMGEKLDKANARKMPSGSYGYWAAGMKHMVWAEGETVVQVHGTGPWSINYLNPADDPRNKK
jgi:hypothetical protein